MTTEELDSLYKKFDTEFEAYKNYFYQQLKKDTSLNYKNILIASILNRSLSLIEAFKLLLPSNNIIVLNSLIRLQLDNCIFIYGIKLLIDDSYNIDEIGKAIIKGNKKLSDYKIDKVKLYDTYIISKLNEKYKNNIEDMYNFYCRFVHFSDSALLSASEIKDDNLLSIGLSKDYSRFEKNVLENANSFSELNKFVLILLNKEWKDIPSGTKMNK